MFYFSAVKILSTTWLTHMSIRGHHNIQRHMESTCWRGVAVQEGSPQRGRSILHCCEESAERKISRLYLLFLWRGGGGGGYNRLHGNWSEKTLCRSTPRRPGSSLFLACCFKKLFSLFCKYFVAENFVCLISYASSSPYENILTTKISPFMVHITYT